MGSPLDTMQPLGGDTTAGDNLNSTIASANGPTPATTNNLTDGTTPGSILDGQLSAAMQQTGTLYNGKTTFDNTVTGFILGLDSSIATPTIKFYIGTLSNYFNFDGTNIIISGGIVASSIDIPDKVTANSFHVDSSGNTWWGATTFANAAASIDDTGNMIVNSLQRKDLHWITLFESIDGYAKSGTPILNQDSVTLITTASNGNACELQKIATYSTHFTWAKMRRIKFGFKISAQNSQDVIIATGVGQYASRTQNHFGFYISNYTLYGITADGSNYNVVSYGTIAAGVGIECEAVFTPGVDVKFYFNGTYFGSSVVNLPSGTTSANWLFDAEITTRQNVANSVLITYFDFWQEN